MKELYRCRPRCVQYLFHNEAVTFFLPTDLVFRFGSERTFFLRRCYEINKLPPWPNECRDTAYVARLFRHKDYSLRGNHKVEPDDTDRHRPAQPTNRQYTRGCRCGCGTGALSFA